MEIRLGAAFLSTSREFGQAQLGAGPKGTIPNKTRLFQATTVLIRTT